MVNPNFFVSESNKPVYILIKSFLSDKFIGVLYGENGVGKTYFVKKLLDDELIYDVVYVSAKEIDDIKLFLADLYLDDFTVLVIDDAQHLTLDDFREVFKYYLTNKTLNVLFVGNRNLKQKLNSFQFKNIRLGMNFILELKPLQNFKEFEQFIKHYTSENGINIHFTKGALKYIYKKTNGNIKQIVQILESLKGKKFVSTLTFNKKRVFAYAFMFVFLTGSFLYFLMSDITKEIIKITEKKPPKPVKPAISPQQKKIVEEVKQKDQQILKLAQTNPEKLIKPSKEECEQGINLLVQNCRAETVKEKPAKEKPPKPKKQKEEKKIKTYKYAVFLGAFSKEETAKKVARLAEKLVGYKPVVRKINNLNKVIIFLNDEKKVKEILKKLRKTHTFKDAYFRKGRYVVEGE